MNTDMKRLRGIGGVQSKQLLKMGQCSIRLSGSKLIVSNCPVKARSEGIELKRALEGRTRAIFAMERITDCGQIKPVGRFIGI